MSAKSTVNGQSWAPWTFKGVASFVGAPVGRLLLLELIVAGVVAIIATVFIALAWLPAIDQAIERLPAEGAISQGRLEWPGMLPQRLTENAFLGIVIVDRGSSEVGQIADVQMELGPTQFKVRSLFGYMSFAYPQGWRVALNRKELEPWWGARRPFVAMAVSVGTVFILGVSWAVLALVYAPFVALLAFYRNRDVGLWRAWKLASAALMPGALLMAAVILLYGLQRLPLAAVVGAFFVHIVAAWPYLIVSPCRLARRTDATPGISSNPFARE